MDKDLIGSNNLCPQIFASRTPGGGRPKGCAGGGLGRAGGRGADTASKRLGGLASGFKVWMNAAREGNVRVGKVCNGRDSSRGFGNKPRTPHPSPFLREDGLEAGGESASSKRSRAPASLPARALLRLAATREVGDGRRRGPGA